MAVGVDMGGTNLRVAVVDARGRIVAHIRRPSPIADPARGQSALADAIRDAIAAAGAPLSQVCGVGIGIPGWMDRLTGQLVFAPKMVHWQSIFDLDRLRAQLRLPITVDSDPNVATLGEFWVGAGRGARSLVMVTLGTGLGCGIVIDGRLYAGYRGMSGEFGHIVVNDFHEFPCDCGVYGCLETQAAGPAIARQGRQAVAAGQVTALTQMAGGNADRVTTAMVFAAAACADPVAQAIVDHAGVLLGTGMATLVSLFEPERLVVGGGMADVGELILAPIRRTLRQRCYLINRGYITLDLTPAALGDTAGVIGAARLAMLGP